jgi:hypothetical protein
MTIEGYCHIGTGLTDTAPVLYRVGDFERLLRVGQDEEMWTVLRRAHSPARSLGDQVPMAHIEAMKRRDMRPGKRGPRGKDN